MFKQATATLTRTLIKGARKALSSRFGRFATSRLVMVGIAALASVATYPVTFPVWLLGSVIGLELTESAIPHLKLAFSEFL